MPDLAKLAVAVMLLGCSSSSPPTSTPRKRTSCPRLKVTADGAEVSGLVVGAAVLQRGTYEITLSPRAKGCGPEALVESWQADDPQLTIGYSTQGRGVATLAQVMIDTEVAAPETMPAPGGVLELCVRSTPARASGGSLAGKTVQVTGLVRATYCGTREELAKKHAGG